MQVAIDQQIKKLRTAGYNDQITFYASNYADLLAIEQRTHFHESFLPFFQQYENVILETRTKSANIELLKQLAQSSTIGSSNTEIAFSLSPSPIAKLYEHGTASLEQKLKAINELLKLNYRVGLRFLPLLPIENYETVYEEMLNQIKSNINVKRISSIFIAPLLYNAGDFAIIKKKKPDFPFWELLQARENGLMKMEDQHYERFFQLFQKAFPEKEILRDYR
jgi:spore photoproduct lyase